MDSTTPPRFYVYVLCRPDGRPFYVGKGSGNRVFNHVKEAERGHKCHKCNIIRKILRSGSEVQHYTVFTTNNEREAFAYEKELIALHGRDNLCNQTDGGEGQSNPSDELRAKMRQSALETWQDIDTRTARLRNMHAALAKLTEEQVTEIRHRWVTDTTRLVDIATEYGVTYRTIVSVVRQEHWGTDVAVSRTRTTEQRRALRLGERSARARFTMAEVRTIRTRYAAGEASMSMLASEYSVYETCIGKIINNQTYHDPAYDPSIVVRGQVMPDKSCENSPSAKLDWDKVSAIRQSYLAGAETKHLAARYALDVGTIRDVVANQTWCDPDYQAPTNRAERRLQKVRKLSLEIAREIRTRYAAGGIGYGKLAIEYGVSMSAIVSIIKNRYYHDTL